MVALSPRKPAIPYLELTCTSTLPSALSEATWMLRTKFQIRTERCGIWWHYCSNILLIISCICIYNRSVLFCKSVFLPPLNNCADTQQQALFVQPSSAVVEIFLFWTTHFEATATLYGRLYWIVCRHRKRLETALLHCVVNPRVGPVRSHSCVYPSEVDGEVKWGEKTPGSF